LAARLGLGVDLGGFLKAGSAMEVVRLGLDGIINKAAEMAVAFVENVKHIA